MFSMNSDILILKSLLHFPQLVHTQGFNVAPTLLPLMQVLASVAFSESEFYQMQLHYSYTLDHDIFFI